ncbi:MAG: hypothetical protein AB8G18_14265 [Gammaproteobacteria bacterium]
MRLESLKLSLTLLAALFSLSTGCATAPEPAKAAATETAQTSPLPQQSVLELRAGQVLSLTAPVPRENASDLRKTYYQQAFPLARKEGLARTLALDVTGTLVGSFAPGGLVFFTWPDEASEKAFTSNPDWPAIKATRPDGWEELRIYNSKIERDMSITFRHDKFYTAAVAWISSENPDDYERYLKNIESTVNAVGGRFLYKMKNIRYETHTAPFESPGQITFVEWDTQEGLSKLTSSKAYKQNNRFLRSGTTRFELHSIAPGTG